MFNKTNNTEIRSITSDLMKKGRMLYNNFYGVGEADECDIATGLNTVLIRKKEFDFFRLFMMSIDEAELETMLLQLSDFDYAVNIPSKTSVDNWNSLLLKCGFEFLDVYSRYYNNNIKSFPTSINTFASVDEVDSVADLLYGNFSKYTDHLPSKKELCQMATKKQIIADYKDGKICGVLIYTITGNKGYQNAWIDEGDNGIALLFKVKSIFIERGIKYCYYWIKDMNKDVIKMHAMMGGKPDGLKDYNYLKRKNWKKMELVDFIANFADQFDDTDSSEINAETKFRDLEEWSSMIGLSVLNMIDNTYGVTLAFDELKSAVTVQNLFDIVEKKQNNG